MHVKQFHEQLRWTFKPFHTLTKNVTLDPQERHRPWVNRLHILWFHVNFTSFGSGLAHCWWLKSQGKKTTWDGGKSLINNGDFNYRSLNWWVCRIAEPSTVGLCWFEKRFWTLEGFCRSTSTRTLDLPSITSLKRWGPKRKPECLMGHCHRQVLQVPPGPGKHLLWS